MLVMFTGPRKKTPGGGVLPKTWCTGMLKGFEVHFHQFWYTNGGFEIVPDILMTPHFCDGIWRWAVLRIIFRQCHLSITGIIIISVKMV